MNHPDRHADTEPTEPRVAVLKELVDKSLYEVDERAVADAIILRVKAQLRLR
jgi:anti-sigma28 factor (negative regulator of flagellin synthesis)